VHVASTIENEEELILRWEASYAGATREDYNHDNRWFLEFAGYIDLKAVHHRTGNMIKEVKRRQEEAIDKAMRDAIMLGKSNPKQAKMQVIRFVKALDTVHLSSP
jgi:hypothetical protein